MSETKKLIEAIEKLTEELKRANERPVPFMPCPVPYPVPQPYPVYPIYPAPYYPPLPGPIWINQFPTVTCGGMGIGVSNDATMICNNSVDATASYQ